MDVGECNNDLTLSFKTYTVIHIQYGPKLSVWYKDSPEPEMKTKAQSWFVLNPKTPMDPTIVCFFSLPSWLKQSYPHHKSSRLYMKNPLNMVTVTSKNLWEEAQWNKYTVVLPPDFDRFWCSVQNFLSNILFDFLSQKEIAFYCCFCVSACDVIEWVSDVPYWNAPKKNSQIKTSPGDWLYTWTWLT